MVLGFYYLHMKRATVITFIRKKRIFKQKFGSIKGVFWGNKQLNDVLMEIKNHIMSSKILNTSSTLYMRSLILKNRFNFFVSSLSEISQFRSPDKVCSDLQCKPQVFFWAVLLPILMKYLFQTSSKVFDRVQGRRIRQLFHQAITVEPNRCPKNLHCLL